MYLTDTGYEPAALNSQEIAKQLPLILFEVGNHPGVMSVLLWWTGQSDEWYQLIPASHSYSNCKGQACFVAG